MEPSMESCLAQVLQKDVGRRLQTGQDIIDYILDQDKSPDLDQDQTALDRMVDGIATSWVNSSNFKVEMDCCFFKVEMGCCLLRWKWTVCFLRWKSAVVY
uniref:Uncharacterized protein n=1 Tax=Cyprinodon variegatus TaxID=28743 RepID=A0A3Q2GNA7_CYPVA